MIDWDAKVVAPCLAVFGEAVKLSYQRASGGDPFDIDGVFDDAYVALVLEADGEPAFSTVQPLLGVRVAQFSGVVPVNGDRVTVPRVGKTYVVTDYQPDGKGHAALPLTLWDPA